MARIIIVILFFTINNFLEAQDAMEIVKRMDDNFQGKSNSSVMSMTIVRPKYTRTLEFKNWSLSRDYFMTVITRPAKDKDQVFMKLKSEMWNYNPSINRTIKLPPSMMAQGWMGSDYSNDDLVKQSSFVNDYTHKLLDDAVIEGLMCCNVELIPNEEANVVWSKVILFIDKLHFNCLKAEYYDEAGELVRMEYGKNMKEFDGRILPSVLEIIPAQEPENKTIITIISIDFDIKIDENFFSLQNMKQIR